MKLDRFLAGLSEAEELNEKQRQALRDHVELFVRAGGTFDLREWEGFSDLTKAALVDAQDQLRKEQALLIATAMQNFEGYLEGVDPRAATDRKGAAILKIMHGQMIDKLRFSEVPA